MTTTSPATATICAQAVMPAPAEPSAAENTATLLVPPSGDAQTDALLVLMLVQGQDRDQVLESGREDMQRLKGKIQEALAQTKAALRKAAKAQHKSGFWGKLGKSLGGVGRWAAAGVAVAVAVGSLGAATPLAALAVAGAVLSTAAACQGQWHVMEWAGLDPTKAGALNLAMTVAGSVCTLGAGSVGLGSIGDVAVDCAKGAAGAAAAGEGVCTVERAYADRDAGYAEADAKQARADQAHAQRLIQWVLETMEDTEDRHERQVRVGADTISSKNESMMLAATRA